MSRYEQLRPWDKELIPLANKLSTRGGVRSAIAQDMADTRQQFYLNFPDVLSSEAGRKRRLCGRAGAKLERDRISDPHCARAA